MKTLIFILAFVGLGFSSFAQQLTPLKIERFTATVSASRDVQKKYYTTEPTIINSQTDTTEWFSIYTPPITHVTPIDTMLEAVIYVKTADSIRGSYAVQFGLNGYVLATMPIDSIAYGSGTATTAAFDFRARARTLWFSRPAGTNQIRVIVATAASRNSLDKNNAGALDADSYSVGIFTRPLK